MQAPIVEVEETAQRDISAQMRGERSGAISVFTCPASQGWPIQQKAVPRWAPLGCRLKE